MEKTCPSCPLRRTQVFIALFNGNENIYSHYCPVQQMVVVFSEKEEARSHINNPERGALDEDIEAFLQ